ncbi:MAG: hypothetical protein BM556_03435 [Bacteriovorax sp. MedPE-SWde]|nr:MAG: hypothetical protein BM556_03435 [Bacteriovorax sp. MedPE-SWde]
MSNVGERYFRENGLNVSDASKNTINGIIEAHLGNYTFNNVKIITSKNKILSLDIDDIYKKIVIDKNGGYCFEHNKLIYEVFKTIGVEAKSFLGRVVYGDENQDASRTHRLTILNIESSEYLVDVGFGAYTPMCLVPLSGEVVVDPSGSSYRVVKKTKDKYQLETLRTKGYFVLYTFDKYEYQESDYDLANYYTNTHPDSKFVNQLIMSRKNKDETLLINNLLYSRISAAGRINLEINDSEHLKNVMSENFNMNLSTKEADTIEALCRRAIENSLD